MYISSDLSIYLSIYICIGFLYFTVLGFGGGFRLEG